VHGLDHVVDQALHLKRPHPVGGYLAGGRAYGGVSEAGHLQDHYL
jgi:hypothetical protein